MRPGIVETKAREYIKTAQRSPLRINDFLRSLRFHRKVTAVPFTSVRSCG
jgi:hypothetical protein